MVKEAKIGDEKIKLKSFFFSSKRKVDLLIHALSKRKERRNYMKKDKKKVKKKKAIFNTFLFQNFLTISANTRL
jgi:hypothetical protein